MLGKDDAPAPEAPAEDKNISADEKPEGEAAAVEPTPLPESIPAQAPVVAAPVEAAPVEAPLAPIVETATAPVVPASDPIVPAPELPIADLANISQLAERAAVSKSTPAKI